MIPKFIPEGGLDKFKELLDNNSRSDNFIQLRKNNQMKSLDQIALECGTDKSSHCHNYTRYYSMFFNKYRLDPINILEIGIWTGDSLRMWKDYFENGFVYGIDYEDKSQYDEDRIKTFIADQSVPDQLTNALSKIPPLDIICDDGSHRSPHQILTFATLFPLLKPSGYYIVEDCLTSYNSTFCKPNEMSFLDYVKSLSGAVQMDGKIEDLVSDKYKAVKKYDSDYMQKHIEWIFISCGLIIIKKMK